MGRRRGGSDRIELEYNYAGAANNGNLVSQVIRQPGFSRTQSYTYDGVNRLASASEGGGFSRSYGYDRYGNRWIQASSGLTYANAHEATSVNHFNAATNRITVAGATFDAVGNQTYYAPYTLAYDAESRLISSTSASNGNTAYLYDGDGKRVKKVWTPHGGSPVTTYYINDAAGQLAAEYQDPAPTQSGTSYVFTDLLGSVRAVSGEKPPSGTATLTECHDYLPFGRPLSQSDNRSAVSCYPANPELQLTSSLPQKFTGQERDEFGLDFFQARYFSGPEGRFLSPDPLLLSARLEHPQTWNRYVYAQNNPLKYVDPTGLFDSPAWECTEEETACLSEEQRTILMNSVIGSLSGKELWDSLGEVRQNAFVNMTDRLKAIQLADGSDGLSHVLSLSDILPDRIYANVGAGLAGGIMSSADFQSVSGHRGFPISFKDTGVLRGNVQLSFNEARTGADIDMDLWNIVSRRAFPMGMIAGAVMHGAVEVVPNWLLGTQTNQDALRRLMMADPKIQTLTRSRDPRFNRP